LIEKYLKIGEEMDHRYYVIISIILLVVVVVGLVYFDYVSNRNVPASTPIPLYTYSIPLKTQML
jgi:hypothetical protein